MKLRICISIYILYFFISCTSTDPKPVSENFVKDANSTVVSMGNFSTRVHQTSGTASLLVKDSVFTLAIENFKTDSGPDLRVYLSATEGANDYVELGILKSTAGSFGYPVSKSIDTKKYKFVVIWCEDFSVLFGLAELI